MNKGIAPIIIILIIIGVLVLGGGVYYFATQKPAQPEQEVFVPKITEDETADWKTYRNEEYGFEVKYPANFEVRDLTLENKPYVKNITLLIGLCDTQFTTSCSGTTIHIYNGEFREPSISEGTEIKRLKRDGMTFWLGGDNQILSTFKFIK